MQLLMCTLGVGFNQLNCKIFNSCIRYLRFNPCLHKKLIGILVYPWCNSYFTNISAYGVQESNVQVGVTHTCTFRLR